MLGAACCCVLGMPWAMGTAAAFVTAAFPALGGLLPWAPFGQKLPFMTVFLLFSMPKPWGCLQGMATYGRTWAKYWGAEMLGFSGANPNPHKLRWSWGPSCATIGVQLWDPASLNVTGGGFGDWVSLLVPAVPSPPACPWVCAQRCQCWVKPSCV